MSDLEDFYTLATKCIANSLKINEYTSISTPECASNHTAKQIGDVNNIHYVYIMYIIYLFDFSFSCYLFYFTSRRKRQENVCSRRCCPSLSTQTIRLSAYFRVTRNTPSTYAMALSFQSKCRFQEWEQACSTT